MNTDETTSTEHFLTRLQVHFGGIVRPLKTDRNVSTGLSLVKSWVVELDRYQFLILHLLIED